MALDQRQSVRATPARTGATLLEAFDPRRNSLTMMRLALATLVALSHALAIGFGWQPLFRDDPVLGPTYLGDLAVDGFFVISGFLVTMSFLRIGGVGRYLWHRVVRIMPAFWVCLVVTAVVVAPALAWLEGRPPGSVFPEAFDYVTRNAALHMFVFDVAGLPTRTHVPYVVNGALWTLFYEFVCYLGVVALGVTGALTRRRWLLLAGIGVLWAATIVAAAGVDLPMTQMRRLAFCFLLGAAGYVYAGRVRVDGRLALVAVAVLALALALLPDYRAAGAPAFAYLCLWAVVRLPLTWNPRTDLSYGMYIFHWPIATLLTLAGATAFGEIAFVLLALVGGCLAAFVSWHLVESRALAYKSMPAPWRRPA